MNDKKVLVVIPARYNSSRFPGKPLVNIDGETMIKRVYSQVLKCERVNQIVVATDDKRIEKEVLTWKGNVMMTSPKHESGTDRIGEVAKFYGGFDYIVNVQGDEPFIDPKQVDDLIDEMIRNEDDISTQCVMIEKEEDLFDFNVVKLTKTISNKALYFSRQAIPGIRDLPYKGWMAEGKYFKHIGIYGFDRECLLKLINLPPSDLESREKLEQLRWMENGFTISVYETLYKSIGIDRPEDLLSINS